jgi:two-component sensor histidine kinase
LSAAEGRIDLTWQRDQDGRLIVRWQESGGPPVGTPSRRGFGGRVIEQMASQLRGTAQFDWRREGLVCEITMQT